MSDLNPDETPATPSDPQPVNVPLGGQPPIPSGLVETASDVQAALIAAKTAQETILKAVGDAKAVLQDSHNAHVADTKSLLHWLEATVSAKLRAILPHIK